MYESFFHLKTHPFAAAPRIDTYYPGEIIEQSRQTAIRAIEGAEGPVLIIGPAGVGKSLLCRLLATYFSESFQVALLSDTHLCTRKELLQKILFELGLPYRDMDEGELRLSLIDHLHPSEQSPHGMLLIVDEAHTLPARLLEELRMISNLVRAGQSRIRLVLAGGPRLDERFASPKLESFNQRIAARCYLQSLPREETCNYVRGQIASAGGYADDILSDDAFRAVHQATDGIPRLINQVCNYALTMACQSGRRQVDAPHVEEAWADLQQLPTPWHETAVEPDNTQAIIEFGALDGDLSAAPVDNVDDQRPDATPDDIDRQAEEIEITSNDADGIATVLEFSAVESSEDVWEDNQQESESASRDGDEPGMRINLCTATDPFDVPYQEEEVVVDRHAAMEGRADHLHLRLATVEDEELESDTSSSPADESPVDSEAWATLDCEASTNADEISAEHRFPPADSKAPAAGVNEPPLETQMVPALAPFETAASPDPAPPCDESQMFEYTVFEASQSDDFIFDNSDIVAVRDVEWNGCDDGENVQSDNPSAASDEAADDRDLIDIAEETSPEDAASDTLEPPPRVQRMDYRDLFAQLRRAE